MRAEAVEEDVSLPEDDAAAADAAFVRELVEDEVDRVNPSFESYEQIKRFRVVDEEFTEDNDLLTPTMKKKRRNILERYADAVESMYAED